MVSNIYNCFSSAMCTTQHILRIQTLFPSLPTQLPPKLQRFVCELAEGQRSAEIQKLLMPILCSLTNNKHVFLVWEAADLLASPLGPFFPFPLHTCSFLSFISFFPFPFFPSFLRSSPPHSFFGSKMNKLELISGTKSMGTAKPQQQEVFLGYLGDPIIDETEILTKIGGLPVCAPLPSPDETICFPLFTFLWSLFCN